MTVSSSDGSSAELQDVVVGDVFLCSGQSNMELAVSASFDVATGAAQAADAGAGIRVMWVTPYEVDDTTSAAALDDVALLNKNWTISSPETISDGESWDFDGQFSATCWYFGYNTWKYTLDEQVPVGLVAAHWGGTMVEAWSSPDALQAATELCAQGDSPASVLTATSADDLKAYRTKHGKEVVGEPNDNPSSLWNGMIHPLLNMTFKAAVWYQGESNVGDATSYFCKLSSMIDDWRAKLSATKGTSSATFPFGIVQISGYCAVGCGCEEYGCGPDDAYPVADLRAAQGWVKDTVENVFIATAMDLEDPDPLNNAFGDIHPRDKMDIGARLAVAGASLLGGSSAGGASPQLASCALDSDAGTVSINFKGVAGTSALRVRHATGVELLGSNGKWFDAPVVSTNAADALSVNGSLALATGAVTGIRYAWRDNPCCTAAGYAASACPLEGHGEGLCNLYVGGGGGIDARDAPVLPFYAAMQGGLCQV